MDLSVLAKLLGEKQNYLWAFVLLATGLITMRKLGYTDGLENTVVSTAILGGTFCGFLLVTAGVCWGIDRATSAYKRHWARQKAEREAIEVLPDLNRDYEIVLKYVLRQLKSQRFKAPTSTNILLGMEELGLVEDVGPRTVVGRTTYWKVRDVVWQKMLAEGWNEGPPVWDDEAIYDPWSDTDRI